MKSPVWMCMGVLTALLMVAAPTVDAKKKRNWRLGDRVPLSMGSKGHDVKVLQDFLTRAGHPADVDGMFGKRTRRAVRAFERAQRLPVDGRLGRTDVKALRDVVANGGAVVSSSRVTGGAVPTEAEVHRVQPGAKATVGPDGLAIAPAEAPRAVQAIVAAGNQIAKMPYRYGGGHGSWKDTGYDCSGSVSYALHGAGLLETAMASGGFTNWGDPGPGTWVTIYANGGHMYMVVAGLRFDTSGRRGTGTRWQTSTRSGKGYSVRHPPGL